MRRFWRRERKDEHEVEHDEAYWAERRAPILACAGCMQAREPYIYLNDGNHYCVECARTLSLKLEYEPAGRRDSDITEIPDD